MFGPKISVAISSCSIRLFYYMYGKSVAQLRILTRFEIGGAMTARWSKLGSVGEFWERAEAYIYPISWTSKTFQWAIEAQVANMTNADGIIAIDDITFTPECAAATIEMPTVATTTAAPVCGLNGFRCSNGKCINQSQLCDFKKDCEDGNDELNCGVCDFEQSTCGWFVVFPLYGFQPFNSSILHSYQGSITVMGTICGTELKR